MLFGEFVFGQQIFNKAASGCLKNVSQCNYHCVQKSPFIKKLLEYRYTPYGRKSFGRLTFGRHSLKRHLTERQLVKLSRQNVSRRNFLRPITWRTQDAISTTSPPTSMHRFVAEKIFFYVRKTTFCKYFVLLLKSDLDVQQTHVRFEPLSRLSWHIGAKCQLTTDT